MPRRWMRPIAGLAGLVLVAACAGAPAGQPPTMLPSPAEPVTTPPQQQTPASEPMDRLSVVTSTTVLADLVRQVGGDRVSVHSVIPMGRDPHTFDPAPSDAARLAGADLLVINGLGLDDRLEDLAFETAPGVPLVAVAEELEDVDYLEGGHDDDEDEENGDDDHAVNPHLWLDVSIARRYVDRIAATLTANDPAHRAAYQANAADYDETLADLDDWIRLQVEAIPEENRRVVSFHDAFPYFARAYDIEIVGVVVESPGQEPSAGELAQLITAVRETGVRAILTEVQFSDRLAQVIADEADVAVIDELYTDSLGDPPLDTYEAAMRWNAERIVEGLR
jgi:manganese/iron transport system substrate-binding protein